MGNGNGKKERKFIMKDMNPGISAHDTESALVKFLGMSEQDSLEIPAHVLNPLLRVLETLKRPCNARMFFGLSEESRTASYMVTRIRLS